MFFFYLQQRSCNEHQFWRKKNSRFAEIWRKGARVTYSCVEICSKKLIKILALPIARPVCSTTLRRVMELAHLSGFCRQRLDFRSRLHVPYGLSSFLGAFIEQTLVSTNISLGGKLSRLLRFFLSRPSFLPFLSFFHKVNENCTCRRRCVRSKRVSSIIEHCNCNWNTFLFYLKSSVSTTSILVYHYTCTRLVSNFSLSLSLTTLSRWPEFRQVYREKYAPLRFFVFRYKSSELGRFDEWEPRLKS